MLYRQPGALREKQQPPHLCSTSTTCQPSPHTMDSSLATTTATRPKPREMSAEFARLYYFFEKLTQPRNQNHHHQGSTSRRDSESATAAAEAADGFVPEDIVPLLKNLSAILTKDEPLDGEGEDDGDGDGDAPSLGASDDDQQVCIPEMPTTASASTFATHTLPPSFHPHPASTSVAITPDHAPTRPRRNTVAASVLASASGGTGTGTTQTRPSSTRFPLREKRYPFTFKLMLHKLYDLEDWAAKVQEVLASSQEQFRPLNSTSPHHHHHQPPAATGIISGGGGGGSSSSSPSCGNPCSPRSPGTTFSGSLFGSPSPSTLDSPTMTTRRRRSQSTSKVKVSNAAAGGAATPPSRPAPPPPPSRAVKKRIVNRRRSTNGLGEGMVGKMGEWTYDAAVSSVDAEQAEARGQDSLRRRKRVFSSAGFVEERRFAGRDVTNLNVSF